LANLFTGVDSFDSITPETDQVGFTIGFPQDALAAVIVQAKFSKKARFHAWSCTCHSSTRVKVCPVPVWLHIRNSVAPQSIAGHKDLFCREIAFVFPDISCRRYGPVFQPRTASDPK
jgi:hypothetical protein